MANKMVKNAINAATYAKVGGVGVSAASSIGGGLGAVAGTAMAGKVTVGTLKMMGGKRRR